MDWKFGINAQPFKGELRALDPLALPEGAASEATNVRLISGAIEPWKDLEDGDELIVKAGTMETLFMLDTDESAGGPFLLHWPKDVDVVLAPVPDRASELLYLTFEDEQPQYTTLELATDPAYETTAGAYPYETRRLGVPGPNTAPTVTVALNEAADDEVPLDNPGGETDVADWTVTLGDLATHENGDNALDAFAGTRYFYGGSTDDITEAHQSFLLEDYDIIRGQVMSFSWQQATGSEGSTAAVAIDFLNASSDVIGTAGDEQYAPATPYEWELRTVTNAIVPDETVTVRVRMRFERVGVAENDGYIDDIELRVGTATITLNGDTLDDWETSVPSDTSIIIDTGVGQPAPSIEFKTRNGKVPAMFKDLIANESPLYTIVCEWYSAGNSSGAHANLCVALDCDSAGAGYQLRFASNGIYFERIAVWAGGGTTSEKLNTTNYRDVWYRATITVELANGKKTVNVSAVRISDGLAMGTGTAEYTPEGGYIGFRGVNNSNDYRYGYLDNVTINLAAPDVSEEETRAYTSYVSVFVDEQENIGPPSEQSRQIAFLETSLITVTPDLTVDVSFVPDDWTVEVYRFATIEGVSGFYLVDSKTYEDALIDPDFVDTKSDAQLGKILETLGWDLAPEDGRGLVIAGNRVAAMFSPSTKQVCFSPQGAAHAWPELWRAAVDYPPVALAALDNYVYCLTQSSPHIYYVADPSRAKDDWRKMEPMPCVAKRSVCVFPGVGIVYASANTLALVNANSANAIGIPVFDDRTWRALVPESITAIQFLGLYLAFYDTGTEQGGFMFNPARPEDGLVRFDFHSTALYINPKTGTLSVVVDDVHQYWDRAVTNRPWSFRSGRIELAYPASLAIAQIRGTQSGVTPITFKLYYDGTEVMDADITDAWEFNLPDSEGLQYWEWELEGSTSVKSFSIADSCETLK